MLKQNVKFICLFGVCYLLQQFQVPLIYKQIEINTNYYFWQLFTCHFTHINWQHLLANCFGLVVFCFFFSAIKVKYLLLVSLVAIIAISGYLVVADVIWYCGFSGILYALFAFASSQLTNKLATIAIIVIFTIKISIDFNGASIELYNHQVLVKSHLIGFASGLFCGFLKRVSVYWHCIK